MSRQLAAFLSGEPPYVVDREPLPPPVVPDWKEMESYKTAQALAALPLHATNFEVREAARAHRDAHKKDTLLYGKAVVISAIRESANQTP